jgi:hypothetical protein
MDGSTLLSLVDSLKWPVLILVIVVVLRRPVSALLERLTKLRYGSGKLQVEFEKKLSEAETVRGKIPPPCKRPGNLFRRLLRDDIRPADERPEPGRADDLEADLGRIGGAGEVPPSARVAIAWTYVETYLFRLVSFEVAGAKVSSPLIAAAMLRQKGVISDDVTGLIEQLATMRNLAVHGGGEITDEQAHHFAKLAAMVAVLLLDRLSGKGGDVEDRES